MVGKGRFGDTAPMVGNPMEAPMDGVRLWRDKAPMCCVSSCPLVRWATLVRWELRTGPEANVVYIGALGVAQWS